MRRGFVALILSILPTPAYADELVCLANNIYYEARNQSFDGMYAVAEVTLNRVENRRWPNDICNVVQQRIVVNSRWVCQFSWYCDGESDNPQDGKAMLESVILAQHIIAGTVTDISEGATHYHATYVNPYWAGDMTVVLEIGQHIFYK